MALLVTNIPWPGEEDDPSPELALRLNISQKEVLSYRLLKRSVDGRRRPPRWFANYRVEVTGDEEVILRRQSHGVRAFTTRDEERYRDWVKESEVARHSWPSDIRPIVVGAGPAGLFAALRLAEAGAPVVLLERGGPVEERHHHVRAFWRHGDLNPESNVLYGEGGAGAFSDGKIYTRRRDGALGWVFKRLVDFGADKQIMEEGWTHLGTDRIRAILPRLRQRLLDLGAEVRFNTTVVEILAENATVTGVKLSDGEVLRGSPVMMATGHSARDAWKMMLKAGASASLRPIHIGARVEHPQKVIDQARYGGPRGDLPAASYRLTSHPPGGRIRSAHTFCMCPGGTVVAATNHPERVVVNGMSYSKRAAWFANSAVVVEVLPEDFGATDPLAGVRFQDQIEATAYQLGGGGFKAPAQMVQDLLNKTTRTELPKVSYPLGVTPADLREVLPEQVIAGMIEALRHFNRKLSGFTGPEAVLIAPETRTTAPIRFDRRDDFHSTTLQGLIPLGEGAGYAGGIASAALEGFRAADSLVDIHCPKRT